MPIDRGPRPPSPFAPRLLVLGEGDRGAQGAKVGCDGEGVGPADGAPDLRPKFQDEVPSCGRLVARGDGLPYTAASRSGSLLVARMRPALLAFTTNQSISN
jgi:hypothetical protein